MYNIYATTLFEIARITFFSRAWGVTWCHFPSDSMWPPPDVFWFFQKTTEALSSLKQSIYSACSKCEFQKLEISLQSNEMTEKKGFRSPHCQSFSFLKRKLSAGLGRNKHSKVESQFNHAATPNIIWFDTSFQYLAADLLDQHWDKRNSCTLHKQRRCCAGSEQECS